jgi:citrate lyase subunit beta/citryl-CoA lyase
MLSEEKELHISLETKEAFDDLSKWREIDRRFTTANLGILDLLADLRLPQHLLTPGNPAIGHILTRFLIDAHTAGLKPISFMFQDYKDTETFRNWCIYEKQMGFTGKACMGPAQSEIANTIFTPEKKEIQKAREIKEAFEKSSEREIHGFMHEKYGFIDEPIYRDALNTLQSVKS